MSDPSNGEQDKMKHQEGTEYGCTSAINAFQGHKYGKRQKNTFPMQHFIPTLYCHTCESKCQSREYSKELLRTDDELRK